MSGSVRKVMKVVTPGWDPIGDEERKKKRKKEFMWKEKPFLEQSERRQQAILARSENLVGGGPQPMGKTILGG